MYVNTQYKNSVTWLCGVIFAVFHIHFILFWFEKDLCEYQNEPLKFSCVYLCLSYGDFFIFSVRVSSYYPYFRFTYHVPSFLSVSIIFLEISWLLMRRITLNFISDVREFILTHLPGSTLVWCSCRSGQGRRCWTCTPALSWEEGCPCHSESDCTCSIQNRCVPCNEVNQTTLLIKIATANCVR